LNKVERQHTAREIGRDFLAYLIILVNLIHSSFAFLFRNNLTRVLHDDLVRPEAAVAADAVASVRRLDHLDSDAVLAASSPPSREVSKCSVRAEGPADIAVCVVAFVKHDSVLAALAASVFRVAHTLGLIIENVWHLLPDFLGSANESV
jgi:hypothetical protein